MVSIWGNWGNWGKEVINWAKNGDLVDFTLEQFNFG